MQPLSLSRLKRPSRAAGFTLVEMMVVLVIITVLVAMLMPSMRQARESAQIAVCASNFRQLYAGMGAYHAEYREEVPYMNSGGYGTLGTAGPAWSTGWSAAQVQGAIATNGFSRFCQVYLNSAWTYKGGANAIRLPALLVCPGLEGTQIRALMPADGRNGRMAMGEPLNGGTVVGFSSFFGLNHVATTADGTGTGANGTINTTNRYTSITAGVPSRRLRIIDLQVPSEEVILLDALFQRGSGTSWSLTAESQVPHGRYSPKPLGINQATADGAVKFNAFSTLRFSYQPAYNWDRQIITPYNASARARFNRGGYPYTHSGWNPARPEWYGVGNTPHGATYNP